jgi:hypothetical protein
VSRIHQPGPICIAYPTCSDLPLCAFAEWASVPVQPTCRLPLPMHRPAYQEEEISPISCRQLAAAKPVNTTPHLIARLLPRPTACAHTLRPSHRLCAAAAAALACMPCRCGCAAATPGWVARWQVLCSTSPPATCTHAPFASSSHPVVHADTTRIAVSGQASQCRVHAMQQLATDSSLLRCNTRAWGVPALPRQVLTAPSPLSHFALMWAAIRSLAVPFLHPGHRSSEIVAGMPRRRVLCFSHFCHRRWQVSPLPLLPLEQDQEHHMALVQLTKAAAPPSLHRVATTMLPRRH